MKTKIMRWLILNVVEIGLIVLSGIFLLLANEVQVLATPVRWLSVALSIWLIFSVIGDVFQRIPGALKFLVEKPEVRARYLQNIITSIALRCIAITVLTVVISVAS